MIKIDHPTPDSEAWTSWRQKAEDETKALIAKGPPYPIKDAVYKGMRDVLFASFHNKCAYCECEFSHNQPGDVEHFRPKAGVVDELDRRVHVTNDGREEEHPGYYWLAYEWTNLLPSCAGCNRLTRDPAGRLIGKGERFPVVRNGAAAPFYACCPGDEDNEKPVFIHPGREDPAEHVEFDAKTGLLIGKTERGQMCIDLLGLNRDALVELRRQQYLAALTQANTAQNALATGAADMALLLLAQIEGYKQGTRPFSLAGRRALQDVKERLRAFFDAL